MTMFQRPDSFGTAMPPDVFRVGEEEDVAGMRSRYDADLRASTSARLGARQYVRGALHCKIPDTALIIDPKVDGSFDLVVVVQKSSGDVEYPEPLVVVGIVLLVLVSCCILVLPWRLV